MFNAICDIADLFTQFVSGTDKLLSKTTMTLQFFPVFAISTIFRLFLSIFNDPASGIV